jgi:hypothetical protein
VARHPGVAERSDSVLNIFLPPVAFLLISFQILQVWSAIKEPSDRDPRQR